jgi:hypothetical protein
MGQLRQAQCPVGTKPKFPTVRSTMFTPLAAGFMLASAGVFAVVSLAGTAIPSTSPVAISLLVAFVLSLCAATDLLFPRIRPTILNRQTPQSLLRPFSLPVAGFVWGIDTGTVVSTFRASAASWGALTLTLAGWGPWWSGIAYGAAYSAPLALLIATYPVAGGDDACGGWRQRSTESLIAPLSRVANYVRLAAAVTAALGVAIAIHSALSSV